METEDSAHDWAAPPGVGTLVYDAAADRIGEVRDSDRRRQKYWLRPPGGGIEWIAALGSLRPADRSDEAPAR